MNLSTPSTISLVISFLYYIGLALSMEDFRISAFRPVSITMKNRESSSTSSIKTGDCIDVKNVNVPTVLELSSNQTGSFKLLTFSSRCSDMEYIKISDTDLHGPSVINDRFPICSFRLDFRTPPRKTTTVTFSKDRSENSPTMYINAIGRERCINICNSSDWAKFAEYVNVEVGYKPSKNYMWVFSDSFCGVIVKNTFRRVYSGDDLVDFTRKDSTNIVRSFTVVYS